MALYPPIIEYSMPAFPYTDDKVRIYFGLSNFNSKADIRNVHLTVRYQENNANALNTTLYPAKIKVCGYDEVTPQDDPIIAATANRYYIELLASDLIKGRFERGVIYKIQIRFSSEPTVIDSSTANSNSPGLDYFSSHLTQFSEWSTVCLIKGIVKPRISIVGFESAKTEEDELTKVTLASVDAVFTATYTPGEVSETLKSWRMRLYADPYDPSHKPLADSGIHIYNSYDYIPTEEGGSVRIECALPYEMISGNDYTLVVDIETKNGYKQQLAQSFLSMAYASDPFPGDIDLEINESEGYALVKVRGEGNKIVHLNVTLRRTSSKSNFKVWEDIANKTFSNSVLSWDYTDFTIESGVYYQYGVQLRDNRGRRGILKVSTREMGEFEDAFLVERGENLQNALQLKLRYDFQISQASTTIAESKTDTIGSKYPYIRRNGNMYYRTFQGSGLITAYMDNAHLFTSENEIYGTNSDITQQYQAVRNTVDLYVNQYDYTKERNFRQLVEQFLYDDKVKLFKSLQEGNMLVKLMNISLTPKQELGRLLYSFSATFIEVDEATTDNYNKYGIQHIGTYNPNIVFGETKLGQINSYLSAFPANENIIEAIKKKYHFGEVVDKVKIDDIYLSYFRMEIESDPYLIYKEGTDLRPVDDINDANGVETLSDSSKLTLGWLFDVNGTKILIEPPNNVYELKGDDVYISSGWNITPFRDTDMTIDFVINLSESNDTSTIPTTMIYKAINTQVAKHFEPDDPGDDVYNLLWYKYHTNYPEYYLRINAFFTAEIDAEPGTIIYARSSASEKNTRFVVGETGILYLDPGSETAAPAVIESLVFGGISIDTRYLIPMYKVGQNSAAEFVKRHKKDKMFEHPAIYDYYKDDNGLHMYYDGKWCKATTADGGITYDIITGVDAIVNCYIQTLKGIY